MGNSLAVAECFFILRHGLPMAAIRLIIGVVVPPTPRIRIAYFLCASYGSSVVVRSLPTFGEPRVF